MIIGWGIAVIGLGDYVAIIMLISAGLLAALLVYLIFRMLTMPGHIARTNKLFQEQTDVLKQIQQSIEGQRADTNSK